METQAVILFHSKVLDPKRVVAYHRFLLQIDPEGSSWAIEIWQGIEAILAVFPVKPLNRERYCKSEKKVSRWRIEIDLF